MKNDLELRALYRRMALSEGSHRRLDTSHARVVTASGPVCAKTGVSHVEFRTQPVSIFSTKPQFFLWPFPIRVCVTHPKLYVRVVANWLKF